MIKSEVLVVRVPKTLSFSALVRWFNSFTCKLMNGGHELYVVRHDTDELAEKEQRSKKLYQQCLLCGHKTNGWNV